MYCILLFFTLTNKGPLDLKNITGLLDFSYNINIVIITASLIYFFGIFGILFNNRNFLITMLFIEVMYVGIFVAFIAISLFLNDPLGQLYSFALLITVACESAVGLGILLVIFKKDNSIEFINFTTLKG